MSKPSKQIWTIQLVTWTEAESLLRAVREPVFILEQLVAAEFEWDGLDASAIHILALNTKNEPIGCARIVGNKVGRMAVLKNWRGSGVGRAILHAAIEVCRNQGEKHVNLSAQTQAIGFYANAGFVVTSGQYLDLHIPHVDMQLLL
jgi:predicted GNAT family N-acyltransferase